MELADTVKEFEKEKQDKFYSSKHMRLVFDCLTEFGFRFDSLDTPEPEVRYPEHPAVLTALHAFASAKICRISFGFDFTKCNGTLPCDYNYKNKVRILQNIERGLIPHVVLRFGKKAERMGKFIESLPEEYKGLVQKCHGCKKGECDHRIPVTADGKKQIICNVAWWYFPADMKAIPYIVAAYQI